MKTETTTSAPKVGSSAVVRLVSSLAGQYCTFKPGELVKVKPSSRHGTLTVERAVWRNSLTISNVLAFVPAHLVCTEPNEPSSATAGQQKGLSNAN